MTPFPFARLFSMPAFEGLRVLRQYRAEQDQCSTEELTRLILAVEALANSLDLPAAAFLDEQVSKEAPSESVSFYRYCIKTVILLDVPDWAKLVTLGRGKFIKRLLDEEFRDVRSLFRQARLLDDPPALDDVAWWDELQTHVRLQKSLEFNQRARDAELLSLEREQAELRRLNINLAPVWMAIEDNTAGYDILSFTPGEFGPKNKLIEVKSTIANPPSFTLSANEWKQAQKFGDAFVFQIWVFRGSAAPVFHERSVSAVEPHIPKNFGRGRWKDAIVPVKLGNR